MIVSESGRAIAAHHSVLVFNTLGCSMLDQFRVDRPLERGVRAATQSVPQPVRDLFDAYRSINERRLVECYHDALQAREQALQMFNLGYLSLEFARPGRAAVLGDLRQDPRPLPQARPVSRGARGPRGRS